MDIEHLAGTRLGNCTIKDLLGQGGIWQSLCRFPIAFPEEKLVTRTLEARHRRKRITRSKIDEAISFSSGRFDHKGMKTLRKGKKHINFFFMPSCLSGEK